MRKLIVNTIVVILLRLHNFTYRALTLLTPLLEPDYLHPKHRITNYHQFFLDNISQSDTVLDVGCGNGALTLDIAGKARRVVGVDIKPKNIEKANKKKHKKHFLGNEFVKSICPFSNVTFICGDIFTCLSYSKLLPFDVVVLSNVLEHITRRGELLMKLKAISPKLLIRVPMLDRDWLTLYKKEKEISYMLDSDHKVEYTLESFKNELASVGLKVDSYQINYGEIWSVVTCGKK